MFYMIVSNAINILKTSLLFKGCITFYNTTFHTCACVYSDFIPLVKLWLSEGRIHTAIRLLVELQKYLHVYNEWRHYVLLFTEVLHTQTCMLMGMHTQTHTHLNMLRSVAVNQDFNWLMQFA